jgi:hypothetical protein
VFCIRLGHSGIGRCKKNVIGHSEVHQGHTLAIQSLFAHRIIQMMLIERINRISTETQMLIEEKELRISFRQLVAASPVEAATSGLSEKVTGRSSRADYGSRAGGFPVTRVTTRPERVKSRSLFRPSIVSTRLRLLLHDSFSFAESLQPLFGHEQSPKPHACLDQVRTLPVMARRLTKLEFHAHGLRCPYCRSDITVYSLIKQIIRARRTCPIVSA